MSVICNKRHSTRDFSYQADSKTLTIEESTLRQFRVVDEDGNLCSVFGRVYDDACDEGFVLVSHKTGKEVTFVVDKIDYDASGEDIGGWNLVPINRKTGRIDTSLDLKVLVIND